ncbi:MAG: outer membrane protein [Gammaproteobacteria bacterium]
MCDAGRFLPLVAAIAVSPLAAAQDQGPSAHGPPAFELTPFVGYRTGGELEVSSTGEEVDLDDSRTFALAFNLRIDEGSQYELFYSRQDSRLERGSSLGDVDVDIEYLHVGGTLTVDDTQRFKPYIVGTLGATRFSPKPTQARDETRFSVSIGGGLRVPFSDRFSLRLEARGYLTFVDTDSSFFCETGSFGGVCEVRASGSTFIQYEALAGAAFAF